LTWPAPSLARNTTSGATLSGSRSVPIACSLGHFPVCSKTCRPRGVESIIRVAPLGMIAFDDVVLGHPVGGDQESRHAALAAQG
jgi:hypothetical protein